MKIFCILPVYLWERLSAVGFLGQGAKAYTINLLMLISFESQVSTRMCISLTLLTRSFMFNLLVLAQCSTQKKKYVVRLRLSFPLQVLFNVSLKWSLC